MDRIVSLALLSSASVLPTCIAMDTISDSKETFQPETAEAVVLKCEVCEKCEARYRCPGCLVRTCSLPCVREHKECSGCNGQRDKTAYVPLKEFKETHLLSDYRFLEDANRKADMSHKDAMKFNPRKMPFRVATFLKQARQRGVDLRLMPYPMTRRKVNTSMFHYGTRCVRWRVEWVFPHEDLSFTDRELPDSQKLQQTVEKHIHSYMKSHPECNSHTDSSCSAPSLAKYTEDEGCKYCIFLRVEGLQANKERYYKLEKEKNLCDNLKGKRLIEFPTLHVVPEDQAAQYTLLSKEETEELKNFNQRNPRHGHRPAGPPQPQYTESDLLNPQSQIFSPQN